MEEKETGRNRPGAVLLFAIPLALIVAAVIGLATAGPAAAARYTVSECGWYAGHDAEWTETAGSKFVRSSYCQPPRERDAFDGVHLNSETRQGPGSVGGGKFARWRWTAPPGTTIINVHGHRWQVLNDGFEHRLGTVSPSGFDPFLKLGATDTVRRDFRQNSLPGGTTAFESRLLCARAEEKRCSAERSSLAGVRALTLTLEDPADPAVTVTGDLTGEGWIRGNRSLEWSARDRGSGLRFTETRIDGTLAARTELACSKVNVGGQPRGSRMQPCGTASAGRHTVNTAALSDGPHPLRHCAVDFAGSAGCAPGGTIRTDNTAPGAPRELAVDGGDGWRRSNSFDLSWVVPEQGAAAPVVASRLRITGPDGRTGEPADGSGTGPAAGLAVAGPGEHRVRVWLVDAAGNEQEESASTATLRFDDIPPVGYFRCPLPGRPELLEVPVSDPHSGIAGGTVAIREVAGGKWRDLPTGLTGPAGDRRLSARLPSEELAAGTWLARATIEDQAGNVTVTSRRGNGSTVSIRTPLKTATTLTARLVGPRSSGPALRVGYGSRVRVTGRLDAGGRGLAGRPLRVTELPRPGSRQRPLARLVRTGKGGRFRVTLRRGTSRRLSVAFAGSERFAAASAGPLELRVRGGITFRAGPRALATGQRLRLRGRVSARLARRPLRGSLVAIQYLERTGGHWRPVLVTRTDRKGRYQAGYRFRYITGAARISLRAVLLPSAGFPYARAVSRVKVVRVHG